MNQQSVESEAFVEGMGSILNFWKNRVPGLTVTAARRVHG